MAILKVQGKKQAGEVKSTSDSKGKTNKGCWIIFGIGCAVIILFLGALVSLLVILVASSSDLGTSIDENVLVEGSDGKIAVIRIEGIITEGGMDGGLLGVAGASSESLTGQIDKAIADDTVSAILLRINSPGGEVVASDLVYRKVMEAREEKPIVSWISGSGASGAYLIASASDVIVSHPSSITGSIGCILEISNMGGLYDKLGIDHRVFKSGEFKDDEGIFDADLDGEADQILQSLIDETFEAFVSAVSTGRDMELSEVRDIADGRVLSGTSALELGLVDELGDFDDAISAVENLAGGSDMTIMEYEIGGFWSSLYQYEHAFLNKFNLLPDRVNFGVGLYYLLDI